MSYKSCKGYTLYKAKCDTCEFEFEVSSITMICARVKFDYADGNKCTEEGCTGKIEVKEEWISESEHKQGYLDYHADDGDDD